MSDQYRTVAGIAHAHYVVKKSRFFGEATKVIDIKYEPEPIVEIQIRQRMLETFQARLEGCGIEM